MGRGLLQGYPLQILEQGWWQASSQLVANAPPAPRADIISQSQHFLNCMWMQPQNPSSSSILGGHQSCAPQSKPVGTLSERGVTWERASTQLVLGIGSGPLAWHVWQNSK